MADARSLEGGAGEVTRGVEGQAVNCGRMGGQIRAWVINDEWGEMKEK